MPAPASRNATFVVCEHDRVAADYALASGEGGRRKRRSASGGTCPSRFPVAVLARLAVDLSRQGRGFGRAPFRDSALRVLNAADAIGMRGLIVHAIFDEARAFYLKLGFDPSPLEPMTLMLTLADIQLNLRA